MNHITFTRLITFADYGLWVRLRMAWRVLFGGVLSVDVAVPVVEIDPETQVGEA